MEINGREFWRGCKGSWLVWHSLVTLQSHLPCSFKWGVERPSFQQPSHGSSPSLYGWPRGTALILRHSAVGPFTSSTHSDRAVAQRNAPMLTAPMSFCVAPAQWQSWMKAICTFWLRVLRQQPLSLASIGGKLEVVGGSLFLFRWVNNPAQPLWNSFVSIKEIKRKDQKTIICGNWWALGNYSGRFSHFGSKFLSLLSLLTSPSLAALSFSMCRYDACVISCNSQLERETDGCIFTQEKTPCSSKALN